MRASAVGPPLADLQGSAADHRLQLGQNGTFEVIAQGLSAPAPTACPLGVVFLRLSNHTHPTLPFQSGLSCDQDLVVPCVPQINPPCLCNPDLRPAQPIGLALPRTHHAAAVRARAAVGHELVLRLGQERHGLHLSGVCDALHGSENRKGVKDLLPLRSCTHQLPPCVHVHGRTACLSSQIAPAQPWSSRASGRFGE